MVALVVAVIAAVVMALRGRDRHAPVPVGTRVPRPAGQLHAGAAVTSLVHRDVDADAGDAPIVGAVEAILAVHRRPDARAGAAMIAVRARVAVVAGGTGREVRHASLDGVAQIYGAGVAVLTADRRAGPGGDPR